MTRPKSDLFWLIAFLGMVALIMGGLVSQRQFAFKWPILTLLAWSFYAVYSIIRHFREWYIVSDMDLQYRPAFGKSGYLNWSEIAKVRMYPLGYIVLTTAAGRRIWISERLSGYPEFVVLLLAHVPREKIGKWTYKLLQ